MAIEDEKNEELQLTAGCAPYVALQRTAYQSGLGNLMRLFRLDRLYDSTLLDWIEEGRSRTIGRLYSKELYAEFRQIATYLPRKCDAWLDIGCGIGGIDVFLSRHYGGQAEISLLDKEGRSSIYYGFESKAAHYNSEKLAMSFLIANGVPSERIAYFDADRQGFPSGARYDMVISLISWGFHYPVMTYAAKVYDSLENGGRLILDLRKGTGGRQDLERTGFRFVAQIFEAAKHVREVYEK